ncbi:Cyclin-dependent kinase inhibitor SMR3-like protein [Melia azedarach]|uniref:Cyclin-dependent kinase inhibitor SMR3-like protein n=1 Tax=Melia azedarach TaxID=155640 RepID=A0ACC1XIK4_MELAZ|nr:Cyclin-dependent kinase inhibitor SMR3-like protein [Melia azedarach]
MGLSGKPQVEGGLESEGKRWVIAGIPLRAPLRPIYTHPSVDKEAADDDDEECSTPTNEEARIPARLMCPPAPRKRKSSLKCNYTGVREFFTPPDLETVFIRHVERAN